MFSSNQIFAITCFLAVAGPFAAGCSSHDASGPAPVTASPDAATPGVADGGKSEPGDPCVPGSTSVEVTGVDIPGPPSTSSTTIVKTTPDVAGVLADGSVLLSTISADGVGHLGFIRPSVGDAVVEVATEPAVRVDGAEHILHASALTIDGSRCALYVWTTDAVKLACEGRALEVSGRRLDAGLFSKNFVPLARPDGTLVVYGAQNAAYHALLRDGSGQWLDDEKFESSRSWAEDAVMFGAGPAACFINSAGRIAIDLDGRPPIVSTLKAKWCRLAVVDDALLALTDAGNLKISGSAASPMQGVVDVGDSSPGPAIVLRGTAHLLASRAGNLEALPVAGGTPVKIAEGTFQTLRSAGSAVYAAGKEVIRTNSGPYNARIRFTTYCID